MMCETAPSRAASDERTREGGRVDSDQPPLRLPPLSSDATLSRISSAHSKRRSTSIEHAGYEALASSVTLVGRTTDGNCRPIVFQKAVGVRNPRLLFPRSYTNPDDPPPLHSPPRPRCDSARLSLTLGAELGRGSSGVVFEATPSHDGGGSDSFASLPPLVIKMSARGQHVGLAHDAYYYEFMRAIQGVSIPRCYGYFVAHIPSGTDLVHLPEGLSDVAVIRHEPRGPYTQMEKCAPVPERGQPDDSDVEEVEDIPNYVAILVLERLGGHLPIGEPISESLKRDVHDLYDDLAHLRVWCGDIRYSNIVRAPPSPPGLPGLVCPFHQRVHEWRVVDFEHCQETNASIEMLRLWIESELYTVLEYLPSGYYINPEDC